MHIVCCQEESSTEPFNYEKDTPIWLKTKIDSLSTNESNVGTMVYRYEWVNETIYYIFIPANSCQYCFLFDENGKKIQFNNSQELIDFENNRKNEILIWEWKN